ncbi:MAG: energy-coupling factor transporter transmembrane protein EcfT [Nitrososphaerales archaeon]|nr:energy-coupling factor transporter transmembrane protein EcfT [Nitrososphaerales archaeon]
MSKLINSSVIDKVGFGPSSDIDNAIEREQQYRKNLTKILFSTAIFLFSLIVLYTVPLYPIPIVFLISILSAVIGFRSIVSGFSLSFLLFIPAFLYQTSIPFWWLLLSLFIIGIFVTKALNNPSNILTIIVGITAASLFLTSYYFISIPLMLVYALIQKSDELSKNVGLLFSFLFIFIPFNALGFANKLSINLTTRPEKIYSLISDSTLPIFSKIIYETNPRLRSFSEFAPSESLSGFFSLQNNIFNSYLFVLIDNLVLLFIPILLIISFSFINVLDKIWPWMDERGVELSILPNFSYVITLIFGTLFFIIPLQTMQIPFDYSTGFNSSDSFKSIISAGTLGLAISLSSINLSRRTEGAELTELVKEQCNTYLQNIDNSHSELEEIQDICPGIDINTEITSLGEFKEELSITLDGLYTLTYSGLKEKSEKIQILHDSQEDSIDSLQLKVLNYHNDQLDKCKDMLVKLEKLGIGNLPTINSDHLTYDNELAFSDVLNNQHELNDYLLEVSQNTIRVAESLVTVVQKEFDNTLEFTSISISENFISQGKGGQALDTLLVTIASLHKRYHQLMQKTITNLKRLIQRSLKMHEYNIIPLNESLGQNPTDVETIDVAKQIQVHHDELSTFTGILYLPDVMAILEFLENGTHTVIGELMRLLREFEKRNDTRVPLDFQWGKDTQLISEIESSLRRLDDKSQSDLSDRLSNIEYGIKIIENEATTLKKYLIMNEFILNYVNMEPLISSLISIEGQVIPRQLPVKNKYAVQYLQLFAYGKSKVTFDSSKNTLLKK